jgi:hypothetical protein
VKNKDIRASFERTLTHLFECRIASKFKSPILKECHLYKGLRDYSAEGSADYCHRDFQTKCIGKIQFCRNPDALRKHLAKQGLGWEVKKSDDYHHLREYEDRSKTRTRTLSSSIESLSTACLRTVLIDLFNKII